MTGLHDRALPERSFEMGFHSIIWDSAASTSSNGMFVSSQRENTDNAYIPYPRDVFGLAYGLSDADANLFSVVGEDWSNRRIMCFLRYDPLY